MKKTNALLAALALLLCVSAADAQTGPPGSISPAAAPAYQIVTGGTPVVMVQGPVNGCQIVNPASATDQGIGTAEVGYLSLIGGAATVGNNKTVSMQPGQAWNCPGPLFSNGFVSVNAATSGHSFSVFVW